jgi:phospholipase C
MRQVDSHLTNQASVINFIEDNWRLGTIDGPTPPPNGQASFDRNAGSLRHLFAFEAKPSHAAVLLNCDGTYVDKKKNAPLACP